MAVGVVRSDFPPDANLALLRDIGKVPYSSPNSSSTSAPLSKSLSVSPLNPVFPSLPLPLAPLPLAPLPLAPLPLAPPDPSDVPCPPDTAATFSSSVVPTGKRKRKHRELAALKDFLDDAASAARSSPKRRRVERQTLTFEYTPQKGQFVVGCLSVDHCLIAHLNILLFVLDYSTARIRVGPDYQAELPELYTSKPRQLLLASTAQPQPLLVSELDVLMSMHLCSVPTESNKFHHTVIARWQGYSQSRMDSRQFMRGVG